MIDVQVLVVINVSVVALLIVERNARKPVEGIVRLRTAAGTVAMDVP
jgi:hypothetical protein